MIDTVGYLTANGVVGVECYARRAPAVDLVDNLAEALELFGGLRVKLDVA